MHSWRTARHSWRTARLVRLSSLVRLPLVKFWSCSKVTKDSSRAKRVFGTSAPCYDSTHFGPRDACRGPRNPRLVRDTPRCSGWPVYGVRIRTCFPKFVPRNSFS